MRIRHPLNSTGEEQENEFLAFDDLQNPLGEARVAASMLDVLCPGRPLHVRVQAAAEEEAIDALLGAATARALKIIRMQPDTAGRVYTECEPGDRERIERLAALGYVDDEGVVRMRKRLVRGPIVKPMPESCTIVRDYLIDEEESAFFLERYNTVFSREYDASWLRAVKAMPNFARILMVAPDGLAGELLTWSKDDIGIVGVIQTTPRWQRVGVASYLMELARLYWLDKGLTEAYFDVWTRLSAAVRLAATSGFRPAEMIARYPGIDIE